ncbi:MAG: MmgE/PrpD family protein [Betaproteobacteria bacterium]|nr:MmgE/PrpD family protein [Betaproteobacteria bacterium]
MLVNVLGRFVSQTHYDTLPADVIEAVKLRILDVIGAGLVGFHLGSHKTLLRTLGGAPDATVWGEGRKISLRDAVIVNSFLAHAAYLDDGSRHTGGHPSSAVIPSACAFAESSHASGGALIAAVAAGYEIFLRLGRAIYPSTVNRGFQSTAVLGAVSAAAACANLERLDAVAAKNALAIACSLGVGLKEALKSSSSQPLQVGRSCEGGVLAALYAREGAQGADSIIENGFMRAFSDAVTPTGAADDLGTRFRIFETYIKVHGGCRGNHAPVDVVQALVKANAITPDAIERILVQVDSITYAAEIHAPGNGNQAQFSIAFAIAVALLEGNASIFQYTDEKVADPRVRALMAKIHVEINEVLDENYPDQRGAIAEIVLGNGQRCRGSLDNARGEPEYPLSAGDVEQKFLTLTSDILGKAKARRVRDTVMRLDQLDNAAALTVQLKAGVSRKRVGQRRAA